MAHLSDNNQPLAVNHVSITRAEGLLEQTRKFNDVCMVALPSCAPIEYAHRLQGLGQLLYDVANSLGPDATLITLGEPIDLVSVHRAVGSCIRYQHWIAIKRTSPRVLERSCTLPQYHFGALIHTRYQSPLRHTRTRIAYSYCPACDRTTKDYGGKKHTYHQYGTLMSDVWRDIACEPDGDLTVLTRRFADFFAVESYRELRVLDCRALTIPRTPVQSAEPMIPQPTMHRPLSSTRTNTLVLGDCLKELPNIPDNSVDFAFADPPYNLDKKYTDYSDDLAISEYFDWCDRWIAELARVLRPGRTCAILNIPLWAIRHFLYTEKILTFQSWIAWDALAYPVRKIMPAHYVILCFSKGKARQLPGLTGEAGRTDVPTTSKAFSALEPLAEGLCLRRRCVAQRRAMGLNDRGPLTDLWWDIHRLKHNTRRVDHPCQLPPQLMYRLISLFTKPGEVVLDSFNGAGTTTLAAHQMGRRYIGIEIATDYHDLAEARHEEIIKGINPFRKADRILTAKNSPVPRRPKQKYKVPKKTLQLEIRRIARDLGRLPTRDEAIHYAKYPIEYYDEYFTGWGEVCAAARTTGMSETRENTGAEPTTYQPSLFDPTESADQEQ